ncbi:MAG: DUF2358 domain-containing protein [Cyanobacteria bacterium RM1_2_2]|nr:DUF2358 domain-containing protein [Cyanobacteria bacterium RM1_2_2]
MKSIEPVTESALSKAQYEAQVQRSIDLLKAELPHLFQRDLSYDIYTADIYFRDPVNTFKGKFNYRIIFWTLRFHARLFFNAIRFDVHSVSHPTQDTIVATWTVDGILRLPWQPRLCFNGTSTYKLNTAAQIYEHLDTWDRKPSDILRQFWRGASVDGAN